MSLPDLNLFPADYGQARAAFIAACKPYQEYSTTFVHPLKGINGEELATDTLWLGDSKAKRVLVLISATHGVEGFCGSAAQVDFLRYFNGLPDDVAVLLIHAINPHGFSWLRRVTEEGVDLNRNYVDFDVVLPVNAGYEQLAEAIVPHALDETSIRIADVRLEAYREAYGEMAYEMALSGGQYSHPHGLFYGGTQPVWSRRISEQIMRDFQLADRAQVAVIDFHTGLGPFGYGELICDHPPGTQAVERARSWYGEAVTEPALGTSSSVAKYGLSDYGWIKLIGEPLTYIALEFGTYSFENMKAVLRADHWLHARGGIDWQDKSTQSIKAAIRRHFFPDSDEWKAMVLEASRRRIAQAIAGLQENNRTAEPKGF